jgi:hypothetical protein
MTRLGCVGNFGLVKLPEISPEMAFQINLIISESPVFDTNFRTMFPLQPTKV